jgi:hypothetical protein
MYAIVTKKDSTDIELAWLSDKAELTDGALVCQHEGEVTTFDSITSVTHVVTEFEGSLPEDFTPSDYSFVGGELVKK